MPKVFACANSSLEKGTHRDFSCSFEAFAAFLGVDDLFGPVLLGLVEAYLCGVLK